jgi:hypothetical protein
MTTDEKLTTLATKLPTGSRDAFVGLAKRRNLTPSALLRTLVDRELAGRPDDVVGEVERATAAELVGRGYDESSARGAAALNLARRLDRDPTAGAANAAQLRALLTEMVPLVAVPEFTWLSWIRLSRAFKQRGWQVIDADGNQFTLVGTDRAEVTKIIDAVVGGVPLKRARA